MIEKEPVKLLILEASQNRAEELIVLLRTAGRATRAHQITSPADLVDKLKTRQWDLLLASNEANGLSAQQAISTIRELDIPHPTFDECHATGEILQFDQFGNAISNIRQKDIMELPNETFTIECGTHQFPLVHHYSSVREGERLAILNSDGLLELSVCGGSAEHSLQLNRGIQVVLS